MCRGGGGAEGQTFMEEPVLSGCSLAWVRSVLSAERAQSFTARLQNVLQPIWS